MKNILLSSMLLLFSSCIFSVPNAYAEEPNLVKIHSLVGAVDEDTVTPIIFDILNVMRTPIDKRPSGLIIEINSGGGSVDAGLGLVRAIEASPVPVMCIVNGEAASMAFYILQSCNIRAMTSSSILMWHSVSLTGRINAGNAQSVVHMIEVMNKASAAYLAKKMKMTKAEIVEKMKSDWWMDSDEAVSVGAVDQVF